jgi:hypothetical protein
MIDSQLSCHAQMRANSHTLEIIDSEGDGWLGCGSCPVSVVRGGIWCPRSHPGLSCPGQALIQVVPARRDVASSRSYAGHLHIVPVSRGPRTEGDLGRPLGAARRAIAFCRTRAGEDRGTGEDHGRGEGAEIITRSRLDV